MMEGIDIKKLAYDMEVAWIASMNAKQGFLFWNGEFTEEIKTEYKLSLCTTVMNRLKDVKQTLPKNILDNKEYNNLEFVLLDYNSKDGVGDWVKSEMFDHIKSGKLIYFRTEEPKYYSMSHSRNIAFLLASGDIVSNIDADVYTREGFATYLNKLANQSKENGKAIFAKSKRMMRGRLGFFRERFIDDLGGYDEHLEGYGHDDRDLYYRACALGYRMFWYGGVFHGNVEGHRKHEGTNYREHWKVTENKNKLISAINLILGRLKANPGRTWGLAHGVKNFEEPLTIGRANDQLHGG